jgi:hypothetical protein
MGGNTSTSSGSYGGDDRGRDRNDRSTQAEITGGTKKVKEAIKKSGTDMYGGVASKATNEYLVDIGEAKRGSQNPDGSYNYMLTAKGHELKYGSYTPGGPQTPTAMGTVGAGGIMNQVPISKKMFESQKRLQMIATGAMATLGVPVMGAAFMDYNKKKYDDYVTSFNSALQSSTSYAAASPSTRDTSDATIQDTKAQAEASEATTAAAQEAFLKKQALSRKQSAIKGSRTFFGGKRKLIEGAM